MIGGVEVVESPWVPASRFVPNPPKNRREARKRWVIARRRRRAGKPVPQYGHTEEGVVWMVDGKLLCAPGMRAKIIKALEAA